MTCGRYLRYAMHVADDRKTSEQITANGRIVYYGYTVCQIVSSADRGVSERYVSGSLLSVGT